MAWKPKTIMGKIAKGALTVGGTVLGLTAGVGIVGGAIRGASGVAKGTGALAKIGGAMSGIRNTTDRLKNGALNVITGTTDDQRKLINAQKEKTREYQSKLNAFKKLVNAGATAEDARLQLGLPAETLPEDPTTGEPIKKGTFDFLNNKTVQYAGLGLIALFLLPKIMKRR